VLEDSLRRVLASGLARPAPGARPRPGVLGGVGEETGPRRPTPSPGQRPRPEPGGPPTPEPPQ